MPNSDKPHSYSLVLSAVICFCFSLSAAPQNAPAGPRQANALDSQQRSIAIQRLSVERQRAAVAHQPAPPSIRYIPKSDWAGSFEMSGTGGQPDCPPVSPLVLENVVARAATEYAVAPALIHAVIHQESAEYPCVVSEKGAMGLMQLMPETAVEMGVTEPFDISQNVNGGARFLSELIKLYKGDLNRVLGAYNAGPAAVDRANGPPPFPETLNYIHSVLDQIKTPFDPKLFASPVR